MSFGTADPVSERLAAELGFDYDDVDTALAIMAGAGAGAELAERLLRRARKSGARSAANVAEIWAAQNAGQR